MQNTVLSSQTLRDKARDARRLVLQTVHIAQAGHVGGPLSAIDLLAALYFSVMRVDPASPDDPARDRFVLSKGHSTLALYATLALRGFFPVAEMATFDRLDSRLQGHPDLTRLPGLDMSTGSLGQGLSAAVGMAIGAKLGGYDFRTHVIIGDGESQEGQIWEAAQVAARYGLDNLVAVTDWNRLQQFGWRQAEGQQLPLASPAEKWRAFGWHVIVIDGHDLDQILAAFAEAKATKGLPTMIVAETIKGKGVSFMEHQGDWHAKAPNADQLQAALAELGGDLMLTPAPDDWRLASPPKPLPEVPETLHYPPASGLPLRAQRDVFGESLIALGAADEKVLVLDGDLANSTKADLFAAAHPAQFLQLGIAEQNMVSVAAGLATVGYSPWISTFAAFVVARALDQVRVQVAQTHLPVKLVGSYAGLLTNRTGKSHQVLDDLAIMRGVPGMVVLAPADGEEAAQAMAAAEAHDGPVYLRLAREPGRTLFGPDYRFRIGQGVVLREGTDLAIVSTGLQTVRALEAAEQLAAEGVSVRVLHLPTLKPLDEEAIIDAARACRRVLTTEEHACIGGLGSAVCEVLAEASPVPVHRHGLPDGFAESASDTDLLEKYGLTAQHIQRAARVLLEVPLA